MDHSEGRSIRLPLCQEALSADVVFKDMLSTAAAGPELHCRNDPWT